MSQQSKSAKDLFLRALDVEPSSRAALLDVECGDDAALRRQVEALLRVHDEPDSLLDSPRINVGISGVAIPENSPTVDQPITEKPGTQIGPYKLLQQLGEGGMGVVYLAEQKEPVKRRVALKIIKPGMDTRQVIARFEAERQALAMMDHPNIAKVLDAGATDSGRPYFVMELVNGLPVTKYCDDQHLTPRERLELFVPICQAVQHAHQKGIIHRDLKPSNILVALYDGRPVPKIIDFGVAKATSQTLTEKTMFTQLGQVIGTLEYMSPEQAEHNQLDVDTRSDIYSLGVVLYELLTAETPFDRERLRCVAFDEVLRIIREEEPPRPSIKLSGSRTLPSVAACRKVEPARLSSLVRGELDWIVMKALEKDRGRRYETAVAFANDVRHHLNDEPVAACPPSMAYRFRKFARRNRSAFAAVAVVLLILAVLGGSAGWVVRDRVVRQTRLAVQVEGVLQEVDSLMQEQRWPEALVAVQRAKSLTTAGEGKSDLQERVDRIYTQLQLVNELEAIWLRRSLPKPEGLTDEAAGHAYTEVFRQLGLDVEGRSPETAAQWIKSRPGIAPALISALDDWTFCRSDEDAGNEKSLLNLSQLADPDARKRQLRSALAHQDWTTLEHLLAADQVAHLPPSTLRMVAWALRDTPHSDLALDTLQIGLREHPNDVWLNVELAYEFLSMHPAKADAAIASLRAALAVRPRSAILHTNLAVALRRKKEFDAAEACCRKAIELAPRDARAHVELGAALTEQGKLDEAAACFRRAIGIDSNLATAHYNLGVVLREQGKLDEAIACYQATIAIDSAFAHAHDNLGAALMAKGKIEESIACYKRAIKYDPEHALAYNNLGAAYCDYTHEFDDAIDCFQKAIALDAKYAMSHANLGNAFSKKGMWDDAVACWSKSLELDPQYAPAHHNLGVAAEKQGRLDQAIVCYRAALDIAPGDVQAFNHLGNLLLAEGHVDEAIAYYRSAIAAAPSAASYNFLGMALYKHKHDLDGAVDCWQRAIELDPRFVRAHLWLAVASLDKQDVDKAIDHYRKVVEIEPNFAGAYKALGFIFKMQGKLDEARNCLLKTFELEPQPAFVHWVLGDILRKLGESDGAINEYRKAIIALLEARDTTRFVRQTLPSDKPRTAVDEFRGAVELLARQGQPTGEDTRDRENLQIALHTLGKALAKEARYEEAATMFTLAISCGAKGLVIQGELAACHLGLGHTEQYEQACRSIVEQTPQPDQRTIVDWGFLGQALYRAGQYEDARQALEKVIELRSDYGPSTKGGVRWWYHTMTLFHLGDVERARNQFYMLDALMVHDPPTIGRQASENLRRETAQLLGIDRPAAEPLARESHLKSSED